MLGRLAAPPFVAARPDCVSRLLHASKSANRARASWAKMAKLVGIGADGEGGQREAGSQKRQRAITRKQETHRRLPTARELLGQRWSGCLALAPAAKMAGEKTNHEKTKGRKHESVLRNLNRVNWLNVFRLCRRSFPRISRFRPFALSRSFQRLPQTAASSASRVVCCREYESPANLGAVRPVDEAFRSPYA